VRALAVFGVIVCHAASYTGTWPAAWWGRYAYYGLIGVDVFFGISGFVLYRPLLRARMSGSPAPSAWAFWMKRLLRIVPAYWVALTLLAIYPGLPGVFSGDFWRYYGFAQIYSPSSVNGGIPAVWSLCVEMTFYLLLPFYAAGLARLGRGRPLRRQLRLELAAVGVLLVVPPLWRSAVRAGVLPAVLGNALPANLGFFAVGLGLAAVSVGTEIGVLRRPRVGVHAWPELSWLAAAVAFVAAAALFGGSRPVPQVHHQPDAVEREAYGATVCVLVLLVLLPPVFARGGAVARVLSWRWLAFVGVISYGIFLWHMPMAARIAERLPHHGETTRTILTVAGMTVLSTAIAALSYRVVEMPFLRRKERIAQAPAGESQRDLLDGREQSTTP
jgi:peptidoglycan/LPS O-acetylase OafA/YrhL